MPEFTPNQKAAIQARGNVLVSAGAGSGKTRTLVHRTVQWLESHPGHSIEQVLMVTFTDAAAAEMRDRIRQELTKRTAQGHRWQEQLALLGEAHISTLHSFCLRLVRENFYLLQIDPRSSVLNTTETSLLAHEVLREVLDEYRLEEKEEAAALQTFLLRQPDVLPGKLDDLVLRLHNHAQSLPDPAGWFRQQIGHLTQETPERWVAAIQSALPTWSARFLRRAKALQRSLKKDAPPLHGIIQALEAIQNAAPEAIGTLLQAILEADGGEWPRGTATPKKTVLKKFLADTLRLAESFSPSPLPDFGGNALMQDWNWSRHHLLHLLEITREFATRFQDAKRDRGLLSFQDLEQFALQLLLGEDRAAPTPVALQWRRRFELISVDEYQDINAAQDAIIRALSRPDGEANRFLVGDHKQSIYRFRLADPNIFRRYVHSWKQDGTAGQVIPLSENFRSHQGILHFVNDLFGAIMAPEIGGIEYDQDARLLFPERDGCGHLRIGPTTPPPVEVHTFPARKWKREEEDDDEEDLSNAQREARFIAQEVASLQASQFQVQDAKSGEPRPLEWRDVVVLLRAPAAKAQDFAREFTRAGVPLIASQGGFFQHAEVLDLWSLLQLLDNPIQDVPMLAVLRSPFGGFSPAELVQVRIPNRKCTFLAALRLFAQSKPEATELGSKVRAFLDKLNHWRALFRQKSLGEALDGILTESSYAAWLETQDRPQQRLANLKRFLTFARRFDSFEKQGLYRFLRFLEARDEADLDENAARVEACEAVRLMSIHQSKGLEFPVVFVADLGKQFNLQDLSKNLLLDEEFGLCPTVTPPQSKLRYESVAHWAARQRHLPELLGEELRLMYVALTRACQKLYLVGSVTEAKETSVALEPDLLEARKPFDWIGPWLTDYAANHPDLTTLTQHGELPVQEETAQPEPVAAPPALPEPSEVLLQRFTWQYPRLPSTTEPAKTSVSVLRKRLVERDDEAPVARFLTKPAGSRKPGQALEYGTVHHLFLEHLDIERIRDRNDLKMQMAEMVQSEVLTRSEAEMLDLESLARFWTSPFGQLIARRPSCIQRELPFTVRLNAGEIPGLAEGCDRDFVVAQGVVDLAMIDEDEIWILDFKTDQVSPTEVSARAAQYQPQIEIYSRALEKVFHRPVTKKALFFLRPSELFEF